MYVGGQDEEGGGEGVEEGGTRAEDDVGSGRSLKSVPRICTWDRARESARVDSRAQSRCLSRARMHPGNRRDATYFFSPRYISVA